MKIECWIRKTNCVTKVPFSLETDTTHYKWVVRLLWIQLGALNDNSNKM